MSAKIFILLILCFNWGSIFNYIVFGFFLIFYFLKKSTNFLTGRPIKFSLKIYDWLPFIFVLAWAYGVLIGLIMGNNIEFIVRNFAGMFFYLSYYIILGSNLKKATLFKITVIGVLVTLFSNITIFILHLAKVDIINNSVVNYIFGSYQGGASTGQLRIFSVSQLMVFIIMSLMMVRFIEPRRYKTALFQEGLQKSKWITKSLSMSLLFFILSLFVAVFMPASKGYVLAVMFLFFTLFYLLYMRNFFSNKYSISKLFFIPIVILGIIVFIVSGYDTIAQNIFATGDASNAVRYQQFYELVNDINVFGNGLGAAIPTIRSEAFPYAAELTFINLIHKIGIVAIPVFSVYIYTFIISIKALKNKNIPIIYSAMSLGSMMYVFPSIGNPILFAPQMVLLHCLALLILREN